MDELYEKHKREKHLEKLRGQLRTKQEKIRGLRLEINTTWIDYCSAINRAEKNKPYLHKARELLVKQLTDVGPGPSPNIEESLAAVMRLREAQASMDGSERDLAK